MKLYLARDVDGTPCLFIGMPSMGVKSWTIPKNCRLAAEGSDLDGLDLPPLQPGECIEVQIVPAKETP